MKYGRLVFIEKLCGGKYPKALYLCDCGKKKEIAIVNVKAGRTVSCGCRLKETHTPTHGMTNTPTYHTWENMIARCKVGTVQHNNSIGSYHNIFVCKEWLSFEVFFADMGVKPRGTSIDRINGDLGYFKENCRWATRKEQQSNIKSNRWIDFNGKKVLISHFLKNNNIQPGSFYRDLGTMSLEDAIDKRLGCAAIIKGLSS